MLVFQDALAKRPVLWNRLRIVMLTITLFWIGWYAHAQLSVINVLTFTNALRTEFDWTFFLLDPLMFILWSFVAVALLFWARGVFCGWLCPFGALQELTNRAARALRVPQIQVPFGLHERLWPIKYILFIALFAVSLSSMERAAVYAEVEPFKTAITLRFMRDWIWVAYPVALLTAGLFIERFYCRYLCALGAALAIPAQLRMFRWLETASAVRPGMPDLRAALPGAGDPSDRRDQSERMHPLPEVPDPLLRHLHLPAHDHPAQTARGQGGRRDDTRRRFR